MRDGARRAMRARATFSGDPGICMSRHGRSGFARSRCCRSTASSSRRSGPPWSILTAPPPRASLRANDPRSADLSGARTRFRAPLSSSRLRAVRSRPHRRRRLRNASVDGTLHLLQPHACPRRLLGGRVGMPLRLPGPRLGLPKTLLHPLAERTELGDDRPPARSSGNRLLHLGVLPARAAPQTTLTRSGNQRPRRPAGRCLAYPNRSSRSASRRASMARRRCSSTSPIPRAAARSCSSAFRRSVRVALR